MREREPSGSKWSTVLLLVCLLAGGSMAALWLWPPDDRGPASGDDLGPDPTKPDAGAPWQHTSGAPDSTLHAQEDSTERTPAPTAGTTPPLRFEECVTRLCDLGLRTAELAQEDEIEQAKLLDAKARALLAELLAAFDDAGERSLAMVTETWATDQRSERPPAENTRLGVLQLILQAELTRREDAAAKFNERSRINPLVQHLLDSMPICAVTAQMGDRCLNQAPHLRLPHEPSVLHLIQLASAGEFERAIATNMLLTLWQNLEASGERSSEELAQLALLKLDGKDPSEAIAACRHLLADSRFRSLVIAWLREGKDPGVTEAVARIAARELPPREALSVLRQLSPLLQQTRGVYMVLGVRAPDIIADAYREHLAANNHPQIRRELVMGVGMVEGTKGLDVAELALANDPTPAVRIQAMFVLTGHGSADAAERAVTTLLDDPTIAGNPNHLGAIVLALQNLEQGDPNVIARLGARLKSLALTKSSREQLNEILARSLPGGAPSTKQTGAPKLFR